MIRLPGALRRLKPEVTVWLQAKIAFLLWGILFFLSVPHMVSSEIGPGMSRAVSVFIMLGSLVSIIGLLGSSDVKSEDRLLALKIELAGLILLMVGPMSYLVVILLEGPDSILGWSRIAFAWALSSLLSARMFIVYRMIKFWGVGHG
jgi:hypothetical protein